MNKQKPMPKLKFKIMTFIMSIRKMFRNINEEVCLTGIKRAKQYKLISIKTILSEPMVKNEKA